MTFSQMANRSAQQKPLFACNILAFNRKPTAKPGKERVEYTISMHFEDKEWKLYKYYTDFVKLCSEIGKSQLSTTLKDLPSFPPRHPSSMLLDMKFSRESVAIKTEMPFLTNRMQVWMTLVKAAIDSFNTH